MRAIRLNYIELETDLERSIFHESNIIAYGRNEGLRSNETRKRLRHFPKILLLVAAASGVEGRYAQDAL